MADDPLLPEDDSDDYALVRCPACGHEYIELSGKCPACGHWGHGRERRPRWIWWLGLLLLISFVLWAVL